MRQIYLFFLLISIGGCSPTEFFYKCDYISGDKTFIKGLIIDLNKKAVSYEFKGDGRFRDYQITENEKTYIKAVWYSEERTGTGIIYDPPDSLNIVGFDSEPKEKSELIFNKLTDKVTVTNYLLERSDSLTEKTYKRKNYWMQICENAGTLRF